MILGVLASGELGNVILEQLIKSYQIGFVCTDSKSVSIIEFADAHQLPIFKGNPRTGAIDAFLQSNPCDVLISINYLFLIEKNLIRHPKKAAFNIHGSLLPKYRGRTPHVWAIINGETETGITAHLIDEGCDTGAIIEQVKVGIAPTDTGASILEKYKSLYYPLIQNTLNKLAHSEQLHTIAQVEENATYFGKRTPKDGEINWNWDSTRIYNWIRAQSDPYPGAFTYYEQQKIILDFVEIRTTDFNSELPNGTIIHTNPLCIKVSDGILEVTKLRAGNCIFESGKILHHENR